MTDSNATELLCCPFCGGEAVFMCGFDGKTTIECINCRVLMDNSIAAWNTRTERTCELVNLGGINGSVPLFMCKSCESLFYGNAYGEAPNYCPNCGSKVVDE